MNNDTLRYIKAGVISAGTFLFGEMDVAIQALMVMLVLDYISGLIAAWYTDKANSKKGLKGIMKKVLYMVVVAAVHVIDSAVQAGGWMRNIVITFFIANEGLSILENASRTSLPIPQVIIDKLEQLKGSSDKGEEKGP